MSEPARRHIRVSELRLRIPRRSGNGTFEFPKHLLNWTDTFEDPATGEVYELAYVLEQLEAQGWDVHELMKGRGEFREQVERLPLPYGGQFAPGNPTKREA
jgi:hypothetical protein